MGPIFLIHFVPEALLPISVLEVSRGKSVMRAQVFKPRTQGVEMAGDALPSFLLAMHQLFFMIPVLY